jgi:predicted O-linked N-acetylglucosamine transferase (SPINDLY family)
MDYIIADKTVIPEDQHCHYSEKVVYLPHTYQPTDRMRGTSQRVFTRAECGLPASGFVFSCFSTSHKLMPRIFDVWMRLLKQVEDSVLWLAEINPSVRRNLRQEAERRGISAERLLFAPFVQDPRDHWARESLADLFLDTLPHNAHATASDALWCGVPVLTCLGNTFPGRVAASLLHAIGLPELITTSLQDYESLALRLAQDPVQLGAIRAKLAHNRHTYPLFDTPRFTHDIEAAYRIMWERVEHGLLPASFAVEQKRPG